MRKSKKEVSVLACSMIVLLSLRAPLSHYVTGTDTCSCGQVMGKVVQDRLCSTLYYAVVTTPLLSINRLSFLSRRAVDYLFTRLPTFTSFVFIEIVIGNVTVP